MKSFIIAVEQTLEKIRTHFALELGTLKKNLRFTNQ